MAQVSASQDFSAFGRTSHPSLENRYADTQAAAVRPHWISRSNSFWFKRSNAQGDHSFVYVDPNQGVRRPAFDHEGVASALRQQGVKATAANLPFASIDATENCTTIKFHAGDKNWEWTQDGTLEVFNGEIDDGIDGETLKPLVQERPPVKHSAPTKIKFINKKNTPVSIFWVDAFGQEKHYHDIAAGSTATQETYEGHVWRVTDGNGEAIASFAAASEEKIAVIEDRISPARPLPRTLNSINKRQTNVTVDGPGIFLRDNNVWFREEDGRETQLSTTGAPGSGFVDQTWFSPDNKFVIAVQSTQGEDRVIYMVESSPKDQLQPRLRELLYEKPGDRSIIWRPRMFDLKTKQEVPTDDTLFQNPYNIDMDNGGWNAEGTEFRFGFNQRGHQILRVIGMNTQGQVRVLVEETSKTFIDHSEKFYYREVRASNSSELIWASERDGWNHLYLYDLNSGKLKNQITKGEWVVRQVDYVDDEARQIWIRVFGVVPGQDPYYAHLARVNFDGTGFTILTEGDGTHSWSFSPDRTTFTDTWSCIDMVPRTVTRNAQTGEAIGDIVDEASPDWLRGPMPERFVAPGRDNSTSIYGLILRPKDMDNSTKYPVVEMIYAGPLGFNVPKEFVRFAQAQEIVDLGFVVVILDGMGTNWRSKAFHDVCWKNLKDAGFPDRIAWMKAAASTRPWMDISRVGVIGSSAGGQNAMGALLFHNDFYSVAVADSGCHDNRMDKLPWNELFMGWPVDKSYEESSNTVNAAKLEGSLMLIVGELDDNVDPASTSQVVNALNIAEKDYDFLFMPGGGHGVGANNPYAWKKSKQFLWRKLKGTEPPKDMPTWDEV